MAHTTVYGHPSPASSATTTPSTNSPTSPRLPQLPLPSRQLRPPKAPLYVPAALRPTERRSKASPPSPPRSVDGSLDLNEPISRSSTRSGFSRLAEEEWLRTEHLGEVTGLPTREHWKVSRLPVFRVEPSGYDRSWSLVRMASIFPRITCSVLLLA